MNGREKFELLRLEKEICSAQLHVSISMLNRILIISFDGTDGYDYYVDEEITNIYDYNVNAKTSVPTKVIDVLR